MEGNRRFDFLLLAAKTQSGDHADFIAELQRLAAISALGNVWRGLLS